MSRYKPDCERRKRFRWTPAADRELRALYADGYVVSMIARNMDLTRSVIKNRIHNLKLKRNNVPANKGLRRPGYAPGRMRETQFKKGHRPGNLLPIGTIKANADGYLRIKISDKPNNGHGANDRNWEFVHVRVWEAAHGKIPKGYRIWWKDRNHENCALENLELLSAQEHMARTTIHNLPPELKETIQLAGRLKRRIRRRLREEQAK